MKLDFNPAEVAVRAIAAGLIHPAPAGSQATSSMFNHKERYVRLAGKYHSSPAERKAARERYHAKVKAGKP